MLLLAEIQTVSAKKGYFSLGPTQIFLSKEEVDAAPSEFKRTVLKDTTMRKKNLHDFSFPS